MASRTYYQSLDELFGYFGIKKDHECAHLNHWLSPDVDSSLTEAQRQHLQDKAALASYEGSQWNEEELKIKLIAILFDIAQVEEANRLKVFFERPLKAVFDNKLTLSVIADCLMATPLGLNTPQKPYFFLQEYKKAKGDKYDPEAQMLSAMLIAQRLNQDANPIYGGFVIGLDFYFTTLVEKSYCVSRLYHAAKVEDLVAIVLLLRKLKEIIVTNDSFTISN
jgi:hypothetical protein